MGNCLRLERGKSSSSSMVWAENDDDDDWDSSLATKKSITDKKQRFLDDHSNGANFSTSSTSSSLHSSSIHKEIKIKITKKQLEKLLGEVDMHEMPVDQLLSRLINNASDDDDQQYSTSFQHQLSWRPRLQSIPEVD